MAPAISPQTLFYLYEPYSSEDALEESIEESIENPSNGTLSTYTYAAALVIRPSV
jgi:hypothetical protein